jgi:hypothetical protein
LNNKASPGALCSRHTFPDSAAAKSSLCREAAHSLLTPYLNRDEKIAGQAGIQTL